YDKEVKSSTQNTLTIVGILFITAFTEGSLLISFMILIFYYFRNDRRMLIISYIVLSLIFTISDFSYQGLFIENYQWMMVFALPFFFIYNGKKGRDVKYIFYAFYPLHIWILYIIVFFMEK
ncbi:MAG: conjugal transfer protein TraX, partial [Clostridiales bacterium]|nr:conjugal transfer protein TraX [Clostridiales bacterium]